MQRSKRFRAIKLLVPGLFLLILGLGNLFVGLYKAAEYRAVLADLNPTAANEAPVLVNVSPLRRIQMAKVAETRSYQRRNKAQGRYDFYRLVVFGGQAFISVSVMLLLGSATLRYIETEPFRRRKLRAAQS